MNTGWICPKCRKANAPWIASCDCISVCSPQYPTHPPMPHSIPTTVPDFGTGNEFFDNDNHRTILKSNDSDVELTRSALN